MGDRCIIFIVATVIFPSLAEARRAGEGYIPESIIERWAEHAIPLEGYVKLGYGMTKLEDAYSSEWCPQQAVTISPSYADSEACERLLDKMRELGRIK